jgi:hypothetical protein
VAASMEGGATIVGQLGTTRTRKKGDLK